MDYPWYKTVTGRDLQQGDIFLGYPVFEVNVTESDIEAAKSAKTPQVDTKFSLLNVIVLSQSCDLANKKINTVILCPIWRLSELENKLGNNRKEREKKKEEIRQGKQPALHMLNTDNLCMRELCVVEFKRIYTTPKNVLQSFANNAGSRVRLLPPYREHMAQAFARYFMRVGLPSDIPKFT